MFIIIYIHTDNKMSRLNFFINKIYKIWEETLCFLFY